MASKKKQLTRQELELRYRFRNKRIDVAGSITTSAIKYGSFVVVAMFLSDSIGSVAGQTTIADFGLTILGDFTVNQGLHITMTLSAVIYALRERKLRRDKTDYLVSRLKEYETRFDPKRSSSRITERGTTRPEDRD